MPPIVYISRKENISAAHRLHSPHLSDEENKDLFGKCNNPNGHGHNYSIEVILRGPINEKTGMVINLVDLKIAIKKGISDVLDHKNLDKDVAWFQSRVSTTENVAVFCWESMKKELGSEHCDKLYEVIVGETDKNVFHYKGE